MHILPTGLALGLITFLAPAPSAPVATAYETTAPHEATIARLVPDGATIVMRFRSFDELVAAMAPFGETFEMPPEAMTIDQLFSNFEIEGDPALVDRKRPFVIALTLPPDGEPRQTTIVPVTDAAAFRSSAGGQTSVELDGYVGVSATAGYAPRAEPNPLAIGLPATVFAARIDLEAIVEMYRPMIDDTLEGLEEAAASEQTAEMDLSSIFEWYMDRIEEFLDSADELDLGFDARGTKVDFRWVYRTLPDSSMAELASGKPSPVSALASFLDPADPIAMCVGADLSEWVATYQDLFDGLVSVYPEPMRDSMSQAFASFETIGPLLGAGFAGSGGFGPDGLRFRYAMLSSEPQKLIAAMVDTYRKLSVPGGLMQIEEPVVERHGDLDVTRLKLRVNYDALQSIVEDAGSTETIAPQEMRAMFEAMYGKDGTRMAMAAKDGRVLMVMGGDDAYHDAALARLVQPGAPAGAFEPLFREIDGAHPSLLFRMDFPRLMQSMRGVIGPATGMPDAMPDFGDLSAPLDFHCGARGLEWRGALSFDFEDYNAFVETMNR